ncbi:MAG: hypothetical protein EHM21_16825 [Chloroflexi bacterium]|nr:MAG: hypothetical protein EHM21_16825 [Chloroflexota bacterium]
MFNLRLKEKPEFALDPSGVTGPRIPPPVAETRPGEGSLYFVIDRSPDTLQLVSLPGDCVTASAPCPEPSPVEGFPNKNNTIQPLIWSPDGKLALLVQQNELYRYDPTGDEWKEIARFPILRESVVWSADSEQLAFVVQLENERQDVFTLQADGTNLQNVTGNQFSDPDTALWVDGFLADGRLLFEVIRRDAAQIYTMRLDDPPESAAPDFSMNHGILAIAPDRKQVAYTTQENGSVTIQVVGVNLDGEASAGLRAGDPRQLASFRQSSVQQMLWLAEETGGEWLVFLVSSGSSEQNVTHTVYAIRPDGTDLRQLFQEPGIQRLAAVPGGQFVIAEGVRDGRLVVIPIDDAETRLVEAPGLRLDQPLLGASWR